MVDGGIEEEIWVIICMTVNIDKGIMFLDIYIYVFDISFSLYILGVLLIHPKHAFFEWNKSIEDLDLLHIIKESDWCLLSLPISPICVSS